MNKLYIVINQSSGWFFFHHPCSFSIFVFLHFKNSTRKERDHRYFYIQDTQCCSFSIDSIDRENGVEWRMAATLSERAASLDWQIDRTRATAMNESVYTGEYVFNTNVYGYVLSSATTIIYKQRVKVLSAVECLSLPPSTSPLLSSLSLFTHTHTGEKTPYRYLEPSRDLLEWGRMEGEKRKRIVLSRLSPRKMLLLQFLILINDNEKKK